MKKGKRSPRTLTDPSLVDSIDVGLLCEPLTDPAFHQEPRENLEHEQGLGFVEKVGAEKEKEKEGEKAGQGQGEGGSHQ